MSWRDDAIPVSAAPKSSGSWRDDAIPAQEAPYKEPTFMGDFVPGVVKATTGNLFFKDPSEQELKASGHANIGEQGAAQALGYIGDKATRVFSAPARKGVSYLQDNLGNDLSEGGRGLVPSLTGAFKSTVDQIGEDPRGVPTGRSLIAKGIPEIPNKNMSEMLPSLYTDKQTPFDWRLQKGGFLSDPNPQEVAGEVVNVGADLSSILPAAKLAEMAGPAARDTAKGLMNSARDYGAEKAGGMADYFTLKAMGGNKADAKKLLQTKKLEPMVETLHSEDVIPAFGRRHQIYENVVEKRNEVGGRIDKAITGSNVDAGITGEDLAAQLAADSGINELVNSRVKVSKANQQAYEVTQQYLDSLAQTGNGERLTAEDLWEVRKQLDRDLQKVWSRGVSPSEWSPAEQQLVKMRNSVGYMLTETMKDVAPELAKDFRTYSDLSRAQDIVEKGAAGKMAMNPVGLSEMIMGGANAAHTGHGVSALPAIAATKSIREYGPALAARASKAAENILTREPELAKAAEAGPSFIQRAGKATGGFLDKAKGFMNDEEGSIGLPPKPGTKNVYDLQEGRKLKGEPKGLLPGEGNNPAGSFEGPTSDTDRVVINDLENKVWKQGKELSPKEKSYLEKLYNKTDGDPNNDLQWSADDLLRAKQPDVSTGPDSLFGRVNRRLEEGVKPTLDGGSEDHQYQVTRTRMNNGSPEFYVENISHPHPNHNHWMDENALHNEFEPTDNWAADSYEGPAGMDGVSSKKPGGLIGLDIEEPKKADVVPLKRGDDPVPPKGKK